MFSHCHLIRLIIILLMQFPYWIPFENEWWTFLGSLFLILTLVGASELSLRSGWISSENSRKWVHLTVGVAVSFSPLLFQTNIQPALLAIIFILLNSLAMFQDGLIGIHSQKRETYGTIYFPMSYLILTLGFWEYSEFIILSFAVLAICDPLAAQVGQNSLTPKYFNIWSDKKTIQGTIVFFISSFLIIYLGSQQLFEHSNSYLIGFAFFVSFAITISEITSSKGSDNLSIPLVSILFMIGYFNHVSDGDSFFDITVSESSVLLFIAVLLFSVAYQFKSLSRSGYYGGMIMAVIIIIIGSWRFLFPLGVFFILTSGLSKALKNASFYRTKGSQRDIIQVYANGGIPLLICIYDLINPNPIHFFLFLSSVSAAMSDSWATEIGKLSKTRPVSITTFQKIDHGYSGGITRIGTLGSLLGACLFGISIWYTIPIPSFLIYGIIATGFIAGLIDSLIGASLQGKYETPTGEVIETQEEGAILKKGYAWITNDVVNLMNTAVAPILMSIFLYFY